MSQRFDVVVAGGGIAGLTAGLAAARRGRSCLILTGGLFGGHLLSIERIDGFPGFPDGIAGYDLCPLAQKQAAEAGAEFAPEELVRLEALADGWRLVTGDGEYSAGTAILAMGTALRELGVDGEARLRGRGVSHCASCDAPLLRDRVVAVVGGGDSAMQEALTLAESAARVVILHRGEALGGQAAYRESVAAHAGIEIHFGATVEAVLGDDRVSGVRVRDAARSVTDDLEVAGLFVYIGLRPNTAFLDGLAALTPSGHIATDGWMRTNLPGLFAAGTVRAASPGRAVAAAGDGTTAALAADQYLADGRWRDG